MRAIMLAAGVGNRLSSAHDAPKCLLEFAGTSLLERHCHALAAVGISDITVCLGYNSDPVVRALATLPGNFLVHYNPLYRLGSSVSLWCARQTLLSGDDVLIMDADVLYHPHILRRLVDSAHENCFLLDADFVAGEEPVKICLNDGRMVEFRKQIAPGLDYNRIGESVGFFKFDASGAARLARILAGYVADARRELPHEEALRELALGDEVAIGVEEVTGLPWIEIDFPDDITRATQDILPRIHESR